MTGRSVLHGPAGSVLFVCTANLCRSPMAMALFCDHLIQNHQPGEWRVESAGTWASPGEPPSAGARSVLAKRGLDIHSHRSRVVTAELLSSFNLVITMEQGHKEALLIEFPFLTGRIFQIAELSGFAGLNIDDPHGRDIEEYQSALLEIDLWLARGYQRIVALAGRPAGKREPRDFKP